MTRFSLQFDEIGKRILANQSGAKLATPLLLLPDVPDMPVQRS